MNRVRGRHRPRVASVGLEPHQLASGSVIVEERRDPDAPLRLGMIRGARRIGMHDRLAAEGLISRAACAAATRYAQLAELVRLGLTPNPDEVRVWTSPHGRGSSAERYVGAIEEIAVADALLGPRGQFILRLVVCDGANPVDAYRQLWPAAVTVQALIARSRIAGALSAHLERLVLRWEPDAVSEKWD